MAQAYPLYINGDFVETKIRREVVNPANAQVLAEVAIAGLDEVEFALKSAREAFDLGEWGKLNLAQRKDFLHKISQGILDNAAELAQLETLNTGKPIKESTFMDIPSSAKVFADMADNLEGYLKAETIKISSQLANAESLLIRQAQGVVVLIVPWNYPLIIASWKLASALAAGNTVILKPSTLTPLTALALGKIIHTCGLPKGVVNIINGSGDEVGHRLCTDKRVDMISFTGSNEVGRKISSYSTENVKKLILELGGKSASIVLNSADLELAVNGSLCSIFLNQGQMCTAMSRILVQEDIYDKFIFEFVDKAKRIKLGDGLDFETQMGPLISEMQRKKVSSCVEKAKEQGAKLLCGGNIPKEGKLENGFFFEPTVFGEVGPGMDIFKEEIFGPIAGVVRFRDLDEAVTLANSSEFGLANCIWAKDVSLATGLAKKINCGFSWINTYGMFYNEVPYGGVKQSGFGKELGREGFLEYTRLKSVIVDATIDAKPLVNYWYGF